MNKISSFIIFLSILFLCTSCDPQKRMYQNFNYMQSGLDSLKVAKYIEPTIKENDLISIQVIAGSTRQEDAAIFNLTNSNIGISSTEVRTNSGGGYQVDVNGNVELPKLGKIKVLGLTRAEVAEMLATRLSKEELVKDPVVIVKFQQFRVNVLGEVKKPGVVLFKADKANLFEALADAGDLTDLGKREEILVMRQRESKWETFKIDLRNANFINSQAFQLQHNDVIYVPANENKLKTLKVNPNFQRDFTLITAGLQTLFFLVNVYAVLRR